MTVFAPMPIASTGDRHAGEKRARTQPAEPEPEVPPQVVGGTEAVHVAALFLDRQHLQASQTGQRRAARFLRSHAAPEVLVNVQLQVRLELCIEFAFEWPATEQGSARERRRPASGS